MTGRDEGLRRRLAALWFADLVGFTGLAGRDEDAALRAVRALQDAARDAAEAHGGRVVKLLGDGALAEFPSAQGAVESALALLDAVARSAPEGEAAPRLRVAVHAGEVAIAPDGDLYGEDVNLAARLQSEAAPGQVVASDAVERQLRRRPGFRFEPLGPRRLKGIDDLVQAYAVQAAGSDGAAPRPVDPPARRTEAPALSIAVLPFANLSPDPENEYFSDGITEEILTTLARIEGLKVISRTSAMRYKETSKSLREIGGELGVAKLLEGSVRRSGNRVRITAQLIDAASDEHLWADRYDRELEDIFAIQTDVAERIVESLHVRLTPRERARVTGAAPTGREAYQAYLEGLSHLARRFPDALRAALERFGEAVRRDPEYAPAWAGSAMTWTLMLHWGPSGAREARHRGLEAAERALALDPALGPAYAARAQVRIFDRDWEGADRDLARAVERAPGDATARQWRAGFLACMGRFDEAFAEIARARELDPLSLAVATEEGNIALQAHRPDEAEKIYRRAIELEPTFRPARYKLFELLVWRGRWEEAIEQMVVLDEVTPEQAEAVQREFARRGPPALLEPVLDLSGELEWPWSYRAFILALLGREDEAYAAFDRALEEGDWFLVRVASTPSFDAWRADPRFVDVIERAGLSEAAARVRSARGLPPRFVTGP